MSIYPAGQCTDECATDAPWCVRYGNLGNAKDWGHNWASHGGVLSGAPHVGAIACFQPGCDGASAPYGHVGIVKQINGNTFLIEEENGPAGPGRDDTRWCAVSSGVVFLLEAAPAPPAPTPPPSVHVEPFSVRVMAKCTAKANIRALPTTASAVLRQAGPGQALNCVAWTRGPVETDLELGTPDDRWYEVAGGGWVASALVDGNAPGSTPL